MATIVGPGQGELASRGIIPGNKLSREDFRRQKDLEAARKAGTAPAALDEEGNAINPHIPEYITRAPWYMDTGAPTLAHQRRRADERGHAKLDEWYDRGSKAGPAAKKYRKGACENCGAMSHKRQDCVERPRRRGAKFTQKDIKADEVIQTFDGDYDAKRDRWNGYDPASYKTRISDPVTRMIKMRTSMPRPLTKWVKSLTRKPELRLETCVFERTLPNILSISMRNRHTMIRRPDR